MTALKVLGIDRIAPLIIITAVGTLTLFGVAVNGLYDLWKLFPTVFMDGLLVADWENILICTLPFLSFCILVIYFYIKHLRNVNKRPSKELTTSKVEPHMGMVLSLSTPKITPEEINQKIRTINESDITLLFKEWSIGQLFKGLYYHKDALRYVWPLTTEDSLPYTVCLEEFVKKFIPGVKICNVDGRKNFPDLTADSDLESIEQIKTFLSNIYSKEHLDEIGLQSSDIIVDITGGTKLISIGLIFGALNSAIDIQYVEQKKYNVIPLKITPEIVLDKTGEYLLELYSKLNAARRKET